MVFNKSPIQDSDIRKKILDFLSRREHSYKELLIKLNERVTSSNKLIMELDKLKQEGLQCDERFTESYTRARSMKGFGPERISYELKSKGIDETLIKRIVYSHEMDWLKILIKEFKKKFSERDDFSAKEILKIKKFFVQRGFVYEQINCLFKQ